MIKGKNIANVMSYDEFAVLLEEAGFTITETIWYAFLPRPGWLAGDLCGRLMLPFEAICKRIGVPKRFAQCFLVCAEKR